MAPPITVGPVVSSRYCNPTVSLMVWSVLRIVLVPRRVCVNDSGSLNMEESVLSIARGIIVGRCQVQSVLGPQHDGEYICGIYSLYSMPSRNSKLDSGRLGIWLRIWRGLYALCASVFAFRTHTATLLHCLPTNTDRVQAMFVGLV